MLFPGPSPRLTATPKILFLRYRLSQDSRRSSRFPRRSSLLTLTGGICLAFFLGNAHSWDFRRCSFFPRRSWLLTLLGSGFSVTIVDFTIFGHSVRYYSKYRVKLQIQKKFKFARLFDDYKPIGHLREIITFDWRGKETKISNKYI